MRDYIKSLYFFGKRIASPHRPLRCLIPFPGLDCLQHPDCCRGLTLKALSDVVGVSPGPVLEQHLSGLAGPGQRLQQVLHLIGGAEVGHKQGNAFQRNRRWGWGDTQNDKQHVSVHYKEIPALPRCLKKNEEDD